MFFNFFFSSRRRHTRYWRDWSSDVCSSDLGKDKVASKRDLVNVEAVAKYAKENNCNVLVTGYCDSATGSAEFNQALSERRANRVADHLVNMGVDRRSEEHTSELQSRQYLVC